MKKSFITSGPGLYGTTTPLCIPNNKCRSGMRCVIRKPDFCLSEKKRGRSASQLTVKLISAIDFATQIVEFLFYLNRLVCVRPGRKPPRPCFLASLLISFCMNCFVTHIGRFFPQNSTYIFEIHVLTTFCDLKKVTHHLNCKSLYMYMHVTNKI